MIKVIKNLFAQQVSLTPTLFDRWPLDISLIDKQKEEFLSLCSEKLTLYLLNHFYNARLWEFEDKARDPKASDSEIANVKRAIDFLNQKRNDQVEIINSEIFSSLDEINTDAPVFSETPGSIIDRHSILTLKCFHMEKQTERKDVDEKFILKYSDSLNVLQTQQEDLFSALDYMLESVSDGRMQFKLYFQYKMYNNKETNPYLK